MSSNFIVIVLVRVQRQRKLAGPDLDPPTLSFLLGLVRLASM